MIHHLATLLLRTIEQPLPVLHFTGTYLKQWPHAMRQAMLSAQLLHRGGVEEHVQCEACEHACLMPVQWQASGHGDARPFIYCRQPHGWGRIPLEPSDVECWHTSFTQLAHVAAGLLEMPAPREEVIPDRLWWLGEKMIERRDVDVFLAKGAHWDDAPQLFMRNGRLQECTTPLILVPHEMPAISPFPSVATVRSLTSLIRHDGHGLQLRGEQLADTVRHMGTERKQLLIPVPTSLETTWEQVDIVFVNDDYVQIQVDGARHSRSFAEMGFADLRKPVPTPSELWGHLRALAKFNGCIGWDTPGAVIERDRTKVSKWMSSLRHRLHAVFPNIAGDPFHRYKEVKAFQVKFSLRWSE
jgi:hypothetical protein